MYATCSLYVIGLPFLDVLGSQTRIFHGLDTKDSLRRGASADRSADAYDCARRLVG